MLGRRHSRPRSRCLPILKRNIRNGRYATGRQWFLRAPSRGRIQRRIHVIVKTSCGCAGLFSTLRRQQLCRRVYEK